MRKNVRCSAPFWCFSLQFITPIETPPPGDRTRSDTSMGAGKEQDEITGRFVQFLFSQATICSHACCHRLPLHCLRITSRLRVCAELREAVRRCAMGKLVTAVFLRHSGRASQYPRVYREEDCRQCLMYPVCYRIITFERDLSKSGFRCKIRSSTREV